MLAGVYLPRCWWTQSAIAKLAAGQKVQPKYEATIEEVRANGLYRWLRDFGTQFGWIRATSTNELQDLAELLQVPVAHTLMGKGCLPHEHPLLLGQSGFWGTPIANEKCRTADLIVAVGTRLAEANSSSWDPRFTFSIPPTSLNFRFGFSTSTSRLPSSSPSHVARIFPSTTSLSVSSS